MACGSQYAIQTHESDVTTDLCYSTSLIRERASWMQDNFDVLKDKTPQQLSLPASHDSGMYISALGKTQHKDIYDQLAYGIRYFDLRPGWNGYSIMIFHGAIPGPSFSSVLADIQRFMSEGHRELAIVKISHYKGFTAEIYDSMVQMITDKLGPWLVKELQIGRAHV